MFNGIKSILLENRNVRQTVLKNTFWLVFAEVVVKVLGLISVIYIARALGATEYGRFTFALSFVSMMIIISDLGITDISTREFSRDKDNEKKMAGIFTLEVFLCLLVLIITIISSFFVTSDRVVREMIWILIIYILSNSLVGVMFSFLRARQKMEYEAVVKIAQTIITTIAVFFVIIYIPSTQNLSYGYMISSLIILTLAAIWFSVFFHPLRLKWQNDSLHILKMSWPLSLGFMGGWAYVLINSIILGNFGLITENGWYGAALKIALAVSIPADLIIKSFFPVVSGAFVNSKEKLQKIWNQISRVLILMAFPMAFGGIVLAPKIIGLFYGASFLPSVVAFQLLIIAMCISFLSYPYSMILVVADQQKSNFILIILGAFLNIVLDVFLLPILGFYGVIIATNIVLVITLFLIVILTKYKTPVKPINYDIAKSVLLSFVSSFFMYWLISNNAIYRLNIVVVCVIGLIAYLLSILLLRRVLFPREDRWFGIF